MKSTKKRQTGKTLRVGKICRKKKNSKFKREKRKKWNRKNNKWKPEI